MEPGVLWDLASLFDAESFIALGSRITLKTKDVAGLSVGGSRGVRVYDGTDWDLAGEETVALAGRWLGVTPKRSPNDAAN